MNVAARVLISGLVQGVCYRASLKREALSAGVTGWVRNLPDCRVEAMLEGAEQDVQRVIAWCHQGPPGAEVDEVAVDWRDYAGQFNSFGVR